MNTGEVYIPFGKPNFSDEEIDAVSRILRSGWVGMGPETIAFERELAEFIGVPQVVTLNSCTSGLFLALLVHGVGPGDEVICPSLTWCSTATAAMHLGAKTSFCDVDLETLCVTSDTILERITPRTKAVMVVHFGGLAVDVEDLRAKLPSHVAIIEDAAHALGARFPNGNLVGSSGNLTCFSFYANKNLSTGEGGAIALCDSKMADRLRSLRLHGMPVDAWKRFTNPATLGAGDPVELGYKMNYNDLSAAIGRVQLRRQPELSNIRRMIATQYYDSLNDKIPRVKFQCQILAPYHARHLFPVQLPLEGMSRTRNEILLELRSQNIGASIHYPQLHRMKIFSKENVVSLPNTERICTRILTLPISPSMTADECKYVAETFRNTLC